MKHTHFPPRPVRPYRLAIAAAAITACALAAAAPAHPDHDEGERGTQPTDSPVDHTHKPDPHEHEADREHEHGHEPRELPSSQVEITLGDDGYRHISANGLPNHDTGPFPGRGNPNAIRAQRYEFRVTLTPAVNEKPTPSAGGPFGIALNGVVFDPFTAGFWNDDPHSGWREAADPRERPLGIDANAAHVQPNGAYHYHGIPKPLVTSQDSMTLVGWAADGFPIYSPVAYKTADDATSELVTMRSSYRLKHGPRGGDDGEEGEGGEGSAPPGDHDGTYEEDHEYIAGLGDLDECNGRTGVTPEFPQGTYYYVLTDDYPWVPRQFRGTPDPSFDIRGHGRRGGPPGPARAPNTDRRPRRDPRTR